MNKQHIRVGVIGAGTFAEECHIPGIQAHPQGEVVALCGRNRERATTMAQRFGVPAVYTDYHELIARPDIDAVTVVAPDAMHFPVTIAALEAGKHVFCEKPLAMNAEEAQRMAEAAERSGRIAMVSFTFRYSRALQGLRQLLREGGIGTPFAVTMQVHWGDVGHPWGTLGWYDQATHSSSGQWGDSASHLFDALAFILAPVQQVCAQMQIVPREQGPQPETVDIVTCLGRLQLPGSASQPAPAFVDRTPGTVHVTIMSSRVNRGPDEVQVVGTRGMAKVALTRGQHEQFKILREGQWIDGPLPEDAHTAEPLGLTRMMGAFIDSIQRGKLGADDPGFAAGLHAQRATDAAIQSASEERWVTV